MKIDLHVHSKFSKRPSQWVLQKIGTPESFTEPLTLYRIAKKRGMTLVTITDHNAIEGALEIAHLKDTFVSEEITSYFPDNGCKIHVLAYDITEKQHEDIQKIRKNVFELVPYLITKGIVHAIAHPLYAVNGKMELEHFEQMLLLFRNFELNGARNDRQNQILRTILNNLTERDIEQLADKHDMAPLIDEAWKKNLIGGSDDHSGLNITRTFTHVPGAKEVKSLLAGVTAGNTEVVSQPSTPKTMAHNFYGIAWQFYRNKFDLERHIKKDRLLKFLDASLQPEVEIDDGLVSKIYIFLNHRKQKKRAKSPVQETLLDLIRRETAKMLAENPELMEIATNDNVKLEDREKNWFDFVNRVSSKVMAGSADHLFGHLSGANVFNIFQTIGSAGGLYTVLAPYFVSFVQFTKDRWVNDRVVKRFGGTGAEEFIDRDVNIAHFTDTLYDINGVAQSLRRQVEMAVESGKNLTLLTCHEKNHDDRPGIRNFKPIGVYDVPEYPDLKLYYPPFLEMINYCYEQRFTHIQTATPGPIGLVALAIANILKLPIIGTYHTAFPQYARYLTNDNMIEDLTWKFILWYYDQMDQIYVSSQSSADELIDKGIRPEKIRIFPQGIDTESFHPSFRNGFFKERYNITEATKLLYVGRVSREKNLPVLVDAFKSLVATESDVHLIVVGEGPYIEPMKKEMAGLPCTFTGYLEGDDLSTAYASGDIFVFPSTTDTFGNVVLEAQASGLPVIVSDVGGPHENILPDETGLVVKGNDEESLLTAMKRLVGDEKARERMGKAARQQMEERSFKNAFTRMWETIEAEGRPSDLKKAG